MSIKEKLQIILITYNRAQFTERTLNIFLSERSPVKECNLLVLDNNSTDNTASIVSKFQKKHHNLSYQKNHYNLGISGNIARALELASQEYLWLIGDDDLYDFSHWKEAEEAMLRGEKLICLAKYALPKKHEKELPYQLFQMTFITGGIYHTSLFNDVTIRNAYDGLYTLFPHLYAILAFINKGNSIHVLSHAISENGWKKEQKDSSYTRGTKDVSMLTKRTQQMTWILGYANVLSSLEQKKLISDCMEVAISYPDIYPNINDFYKYLYHLKKKQRSHFYEIYSTLSPKRKKSMWKFFVTQKFKHIFGL